MRARDNYSAVAQFLQYLYTAYPEKKTALLRFGLLHLSVEMFISVCVLRQRAAVLRASYLPSIFAAFSL